MKAIEIAKEVIETEISGLAYMSQNVGEDFTRAVEAIITTEGRVIICGMGKSGLIGKKIVASLASTGTPSFFMHPGEAFHGDLGMVKSEDIFIAISNSGETDEVLKLLPFLRDNHNFIISMTGNTESTLAKHSHCHLNVDVPKEACPLQLAPTSSTTAALVMGDALTVALMEMRNFKPENFARFHPGGSLGRRLLSKVKDEMIIDHLPIVESDTPLIDVINVISSGKLGLTIVKSDNGHDAIITDGDLRRALEKFGKNVFDLKAMDIATENPISTTPDNTYQTAFELMTNKGISSLIVKSNNNDIVGILKI